MEIEIEKSSISAFAELEPGDVIVEYPVRDPEHNTYLVLCKDYGLGCMDNDYDGFCVDLGSGEIYGFYNSDTVIKLNAKLIATLPVAI